MIKSLEKFHCVLIKPTHYGEDGYPVRWYRTYVPSNSLACLNGLVTDCADRNVLGADVELVVTLIDETNCRVDSCALIARINRDGGKAMIALVGVQTNQFPRSVDMAQPFLEAGIPVCMGGFHVSGSMAMLAQMPPEMVAAQNSGISFFLGEAEEHRLDEVIRDAWAGALKPVYDYLEDLPNLTGEPVPYLPPQVTERTIDAVSSFDVGRGCPFQCSFCTIINVQGRKSRFRTGADLEKIILQNYAAGVKEFFVTDDNFARNKNWEEIFDTLIRLRRDRDICVGLIIQVDTLCHRIEGFIDKAVAAGVQSVFLGLENINPENLLAAKKRQNKITEYRDMMLAWKKHPVLLVAGYIIGFPADTKQTILRDIEIIKRELPVDILSLHSLTPLPGSEDHRKMFDAGEWLDPDLNKYDLNHRVCHHGKMSDTEWDEAYDEAYEAYYTHAHMVTILKRLFGTGSNKKIYTTLRLAWACTFAKGKFKDYRLEGALVPLKHRLDRNPAMKRENVVRFWVRYINDVVSFGAIFGFWWCRLRYQLWKIERDPKRFEYRDSALKPVGGKDTQELDLFTQTSGGMAEVAKMEKQRQIKISVNS